MHNIYHNANACSKLLCDPVAGNPEGINIHAVFVSRVSGEILKKYAHRRELTVWLIPSVESSAWSVMAISFILLLAFLVVLATCFFVRRQQIRRDRRRASRIQEFHGMSRQLVKAMPIVVFTTVLEDNCTSRTCAICLEDYNPGEKLRVLPCQHSMSPYLTWLSIYISLGQCWFLLLVYLENGLRVYPVFLNL